MRVAIAEVRPDLTPGSIAVIAGQRTRYLADLTEFLSARFEHHRLFSPLSRRRIASLLPVYPANIIREDLSSPAADTPDSFSVDNLARCARLQARLKTDYLLVVWCRNFQSYSREHRSFTDGSGGYSEEWLRFHLQARLIKYPENRVVGYARLIYDKRVPES
ncbi:MAG TPA: hypothetical protein ENN69_06540, partial [Spirochaetia bacterium]|nr:hypothetical protein [Spirochaetia bacterium]